MTYAPPKHKYLDASDALRIFDVWTGELKRTFPGGHQHVKKWPHFKWSHDDKYLATMKDDSVYVFETPVSSAFCTQLLSFTTFLLLDFHASGEKEHKNRQHP